MESIKGVLEGFDLPNKWLDFGCHMGYFSLWLERHRRLSGESSKSEALLVDGDSRTLSSIPSLLRRNHLLENWCYRHAAIAGDCTEITFYEDDYMASTALDGSCGIPVCLKVIKEEEVQETLIPPYDLVKVDVEGSEWEFLNYYPQILCQTRYLLLEWHSWHNGGGGVEQIREKLESLGYRVLKESAVISLEKEDRKVGLILAENENDLC